MRITTFAKWESMSDFLAGKPADQEVSYDYTGDTARLDRWAQSQDKALASQAGQVAGQAGANAANEEAQLSPFASQEMNAQHSLNPENIDELLTASGAGVGAAAGAAQGQAQREAASTRNASGFAKDLDLAARDRAKTSAGMSEGVAAEDVMGAQKLRQEGAGLMSDLFKTDTSKQLGAMGLQSEDVANEVKAGQSGWLQNTMGVMDSIGKMASGAAGFVNANPNGIFGS